MAIRRSAGEHTPILTIGYEGADIEAFVDKLREAGVEVLADVRALPLSRKRGFSKNALATYLEQRDILYRHFGALGDPKEGRDAARAGHHAAFRQIYSRHLKSEGALAALTQLADLALTRKTCMMCFERDPLVCHRSMIAGRLLRRGFTAVNLFVEATERHALPRRHSREGIAAAQ